jgi:nitrite reductase (NADH) small subunit
MRDGQNAKRRCQCGTDADGPQPVFDRANAEYCQAKESSGAWSSALPSVRSAARQVKPSDSEDVVADWFRIASASEVPPGSAGEFVAGGRIIALFNVAGKFHALDGICPHQGGPLGKGQLAGCIVTCPWHGFQFDVTTGQHLTSKSLVHPRFDVKVEEGQVLVELPG